MTSAHVSAFILQYETLWILLQLREMDYSRVVAITGDDIYYEEHLFKLLHVFREKPLGKKLTENTHHFINNSH